MLTRSALLSLWLLALSGSAVAVAQQPEGSMRIQDLRTERDLISRQISLNDLTKLSIWDGQQGLWIPWQAQTPISPKAQVILLNLWAHNCQPCAREMPFLRDVVNTANRWQPGQVQSFLIAEDTTVFEMKSFLTRNSGLPTDGYFYDTAELRETLGLRQLPVTLLLDRTLAIRYAIIGSMEQRKAELTDAITRLQGLNPWASAPLLAQTGPPTALPSVSAATPTAASTRPQTPVPCNQPPVYVALSGIQVFEPSEGKSTMEDAWKTASAGICWLDYRVQRLIGHTHALPTKTPISNLLDDSRAKEKLEKIWSTAQQSHKESTRVDSSARVIVLRSNQLDNTGSPVTDYYSASIDSPLSDLRTGTELCSAREPDCLKRAICAALQKSEPSECKELFEPKRLPPPPPPPSPVVNPEGGGKPEVVGPPLPPPKPVGPPETCKPCGPPKLPPPIDQTSKYRQAKWWLFGGMLMNAAGAAVMFGLRDYYKSNVTVFNETIPILYLLDSGASVALANSVVMAIPMITFFALDAKKAKPAPTLILPRRTP